MSNASSIKTLDVLSKRRQPTHSTIDECGPEYEGTPKMQIYGSELYGGGACFWEEEDEVLERQPARIELVEMVSTIIKDLTSYFKTANAVADVEPLVAEPKFLCVGQPFSVSGQQFITAPFASTLDVIDKKYSEVFLEINSLKQPEDIGDPVPTDFAYWSSLRTVAAAYSSLRREHPRYSELPTPVGVVDSAGGVRLIWKTNAKQVKANFGGRADLRSYLYYESGQVYDVEPLDVPTLARRLGWLV